MKALALIPLTEQYLLDWLSPYPDNKCFWKLLNNSSHTGREVLASLLLTEGVPKAFVEAPAVYEFLRRWLAKELDIITKQITLLGSARIGYSLSPREFGTPFGKHSDLDISVISDVYFERLKKEFHKFKSDYLSNEVKPRNLKEEYYWKENIKNVPKNLSNGFIDPNKIPYFSRYTIAQTIGNLMWRLKEKINITPKAPKISKVSLRIYNKWESLINRVSCNLLWLVKQKTGSITHSLPLGKKNQVKI